MSRGESRAAEADYVIVGAGTAGCVLANRLTARGTHDVIVLEAGPLDRNVWIHVPAGVARLFAHPALNWRYVTEPEPQLDGRTLYWPRGKVVGGTSSINGMTYVRGQPEDYDAWARHAGPTWSFAALLPYFRKLERHPLGPSHWHGAKGPVEVDTLAFRHPLSEAFHAAMVAAGVPPNADWNGARQEGVAFNQVTMARARRVSAATAYLHPVRTRRNLRLVTGAIVTRIVIERGRAVGVELSRHGVRSMVRARREVLLCAGTVASPQLLMLSGIGPAAHLASHGIAVAVDAPQAGANLQDHVRAQLVARTRVPSLNQESHGVPLVRHVVRYVVRREGLLTSTASQVNAFVRVSPGAKRPDLQIVFRPASGDYRGQRFVAHRFAGVMAMAGLLRPDSRGAITLRSADPREPPRIVTGHLTASGDVDALVRGLGFLRDVFATGPLCDVVDAEVQPGDDVRDHASLSRYVRATASSLFHAVGTCAMGHAADAVTTPALEVRGVAGLRVVDASVMPLAPSGNTCAPVLMLAERAADLILGVSSVDAPIPARERAEHRG